ncbi:MAG: hypothetical protein ACI9N1_000442 [Flavobacteriales bacterium]|jgi:hypothetical protein
MTQRLQSTVTRNLESRLIKVYVSHITPRLSYALDLVLRQVGEVDFEIVTDRSLISNSDIVINYSGEVIAGSFQVHPNGLLNEKDVQKRDIPFEYRSDDFLVSVFPTEFDDLGFDIFSAAFFFAARVEEYWKFEKDTHGRFTAEQSISKQIGILKRPIINIWVRELLKLLSVKFKLEFKSSRTFKVVNTIDIDNAWAHRNKGLLRTVGAIGKSLSKGAVSDSSKRLSSIVNPDKDPYDTYAYLKQLQEEKGFESVYFFLLGDYQKYDTNVSHKNKQLQALIQEVSSYAKVGIHPSYHSYLNADQTTKEIKRLADIVGSEVTLSRKHFLRLSIPDCYRILSDAGIQEDYTMGYADQVGFRAGLCTSFTFFDVLQDKELPLRVHPFAYMDGALNEYLKMSIEEAQETIAFLKKEVKSVNGTFMGVWHNDTVAEVNHWKGWRAVYSSSFE